eukprot:GILK01004640.1.p1 GENE.GILK01004640.1~~GILK01004640.1.p1  ORF type:complete len:679 (+),score=156.35 GILK01004640.1:58-2037(+)
MAARARKVQNKSAAPVQITAEQIIREAVERQGDQESKPIRQRIVDEDELNDLKLRKRKEFEDAIRRQKHQMNTWIKYAQWEESQREFRRARSVFERALDIEPHNTTTWLKYTEMEMKHKFVQHARNVWDRAVVLLPRVDQFWYKYAYMEEMLGNYAGARQIFERWMQWEPEDGSWMTYVRFEERLGELDRCRNIFERFISIRPYVSSYLKYAKFEDKHRQRDRCRAVLERAVAELGELANDERLFIYFAKFEERARETERARVLYKYALDHLPKHRATEIYKMFVNFEKQHGDRAGIEDVIVSKRRFQYEEQLRQTPNNYDIWFDYIRLEENAGSLDKAREVYERAIANLPTVQDKRYWRRYIYLWINYALFEELIAEDVARTREVYSNVLKLIPHRAFSFAKVWVMAAKFEIRCKDLGRARKLLGNAIGMCPKDSLFESYIQLESDLGYIDNARKLYEKWLEHAPENCKAWTQYATLERQVGELERARALFELSINQPTLDMPELVWKAYIDMEIEDEQYDRARALYERLLERTKHVKVWISAAQFEASVEAVDKAVKLFQDAYAYLKSQGLKEERVLVLEAWRQMETDRNNTEGVKTVEGKMPKRVKKRRPIVAEDGTEAGYEEYFDYIFPDEETGNIGLKLLEKAQAWKKQKLAEQ